MVAEKEPQDDFEDHQSVLGHLVPSDDEDDKEATLPNLDRPLWESTSTEQREDAAPAEGTELTSNKPDLYGKLPVTRTSDLVAAPKIMLFETSPPGMGYVRVDKTPSLVCDIVPPYTDSASDIGYPSRKLNFLVQLDKQPLKN